MCGDAQAKESASEESTYRCGPMQGEEPGEDLNGPGSKAILEGARAGGRMGTMINSHHASELWKSPTDANGTDSSAVWVSRVLQKMGEKNEPKVLDKDELKDRLKSMGFKQIDMK